MRNGGEFLVCNLDFTEVSEFGSSIIARALGLVAGSEEDSDSNMTTNEMTKVPSKSIYIGNNLVTSVDDI